MSIGIVGSSPLARATELFWDGNGETPPNGLFNDSFNWSDDTQFPTAGDTVNFNANEEYLVTFNANEVSDAVNVTAGSVTLRGNNLIQRTYEVGPAGPGMHDLVINGGATLRVSINVNVNDLMKVGDGTVIVNGTRSALILLGTAGSNILAQNGNRATLTYSGDAQGAIMAPLLLSATDSFTTLATLNVLSDADLQVGNLDIATSNALTTADASIRVADAGSTLAMRGASTLSLAGAINALGILHVDSGGVFNAGTGVVTLSPFVVATVNHSHSPLIRH